MTVNVASTSWLLLLDALHDGMSNDCQCSIGWVTPVARHEPAGNQHSVGEPSR
jgi:hypothetical protein